MKRLLVFAQRFPPSVGGTPTVLRNLMSSLPPELITVISLAEPGAEKIWNSRFPQARLRWPCKLIRKFDPVFFCLIPWIIFRAWWLCSRREAQAIFIVYPGTAFLLAGYMLAMVWKIDFYVYFMDAFRETRAGLTERRAANFFEERICRDAKKVLCISSALRDFFKNKYRNIRCLSLPYCITPTRYDEEPDSNLLSPHSKWKREGETLIVYTGQVYESTVDPIFNLMAAFDKLVNLNPRLIISTPDPPHRLARYGLKESKRVKIVFLESPEKVRALQGQADVLFNSVSFKYAETVQVQTLFPTKTIEYLQAGRPMLVHGPAESSFVKYVKGEKLGVVVDRPEPGLLAAAIIEIMKSPFSPERENARRKEIANCDSSRIAKKLLTEVGLI